MLRVVACGVLLLGAGCATLPTAGTAGDWPARRAALQALDGWSLSGRVAVAAGSEGFSGGIAWRQQGGRADISLRGPLGGHALEIQVDGESFSVVDGEGTAIEGDAARRYVAERVGATLPVAQLRFWLVGVPAPGSPYRETAGADGRLETLEQAGWQLRFLRYADAGAVELPSRLEASTDGLRLRLSISDWRMAP